MGGPAPAAAPGELPDVPGGHLDGGVRADHLGQRSGVGGDQRRRAGHRLDGGQREPLVQRRDGGDRRGLQQPHQLRLGHRAGEADRLGQTQPVQRGGRRAAGPGRAHHGQPHVALGAQLGQRLQQVHQALERDVGAGGDHDARRVPAGAPRRWPEDVRVDAHRDDVDPLRRDAQVPGDVPAGALRDGGQRVQPGGDTGLHGGEGVPAAQRQPAAQPRGRGQLQGPVDGHGMVHRGDGGETLPAQLQQPVAERLVVVHQVEVIPAAAQHPGRAQAEGERLGESGGAHGRPLGDVHGVAELRGRGVRKGSGSR